MLKWKTFVLALIVAILPAALARSAELEPTTLHAWNEYLRESTAPVNTGNKLLWIDESPDRRARIQHGEVLVAPVIERGTRSVPEGLIHDWIGGVFIPGATVQDLRAVLNDYDRYKEIYKPVVTDSKAIPCDGVDQAFSMVWKRHVMFVTAGMQARYLAHEGTIDQQHGYSIVDATEIRQIENYGRANQRLLPPDTGNGFIWRVRSLVNYQERDGGVYFQIEAIALTRGIPSSIEWMVRRVVSRLSIDSLTATLRQTRDAVVERSASKRSVDVNERPASVALLLRPQ
jgi:hypothetical protein